MNQEQERRLPLVLVCIKMQTGLQANEVNFLNAHLSIYLSDICLILFRHKQALSSTKPGMKQHGSGFSFKSEERAERRKEASHPCIQS